MSFTENDILEELDAVFKGVKSALGAAFDGQAFFLDLESGYLSVANSRIHLYADETNWAIVFEVNGYHNRGMSAQIDLIYIGNCIDPPVSKSAPADLGIYASNASAIGLFSNVTNIYLIDEEAFSAIELEDEFEIIDPSAKEIKIRDTAISIDINKSRYEEEKISFSNDLFLPEFKDLLRYLSATDNKLVFAKEAEIKARLPKNLLKIETLKAFHHKSIYEKENTPSSYETYQQIARVLTTGNIGHWNPSLEINNHWKNWDSGNL